MKTNVKGFTKVPNSILQNKNLSLEEKGMMALLLSNKKNWTIFIQEIYKRSTNGRDNSRSIMNSLIAKNYIKRERFQNEKGSFYWDYQINPYPENPATARPAMDEPATGNQKMGSPATESQAINKTNKDNTKLNNTKQEKIKPKQDDIKQEIIITEDAIDQMIYDLEDELVVCTEEALKVESKEIADEFNKEASLITKQLKSLKQMKNTPKKSKNLNSVEKPVTVSAESENKFIGTEPVLSEEEILSDPNYYKNLDAGQIKLLEFVMGESVESLKAKYLN